MNTAFLPYRIHHLNLAEQLTMPVFEVKSEGHYLVFWWNNYALGDLYIEPGIRLLHHTYTEKLIAAIKPSLQYYQMQHQVLEVDWEQQLRRQNTAAWLPFMKCLFADLTPDILPEKVALSVVICTRNRPEQLQRCLNMLRRLSCQPAEIIVVDNAPDNNESLKVVNQFPEVKYIREAKSGLDVARNTGLHAASQPIVAYLDDDVSVQDLWAYQTWKTFEDPAVAATTGLVLAAELETEAQYIFEKHWSFNRGYVPKTYDPLFFISTLKKGPPVWKIGAGANMAFRKTVLDQVGDFNELLDAGAAGCNGDSEMWYRILANGFTIQYNPASVVFHEHRREVKDLKKQLFYYMRGHAAAALVQQNHHQEAGYTKHLASIFLWNYSRSLIKGFPLYSLQYSTLWAQISGLLAGLSFYFRNRKRIVQIQKR